MQSEAFDATMAAVGGKTTQVGAGASIVGWMLSSEFGVALGIAVSIVGLLVSLYYRRKQDKRHAIEHAAKMREYDARMVEHNARMDALRSREL